LQQQQSHRLPAGYDHIDVAAGDRTRNSRWPEQQHQVPIYQGPWPQHALAWHIEDEVCDGGCEDGYVAEGYCCYCTELRNDQEGRDHQNTYRAG
jgi:hypothetical protein